MKKQRVMIPASEKKEAEKALDMMNQLDQSEKQLLMVYIQGIKVGQSMPVRQQ